MIFGAGFIGNVMGPSAVGVLNDAFQPIYGERAMRYSMLFVAATPVLLRAIVARRPPRRR
ncbi:MAG: hypothetical protein HXY28_09995 [Hydrogenophilaceae bacterium]|jgi:hypothetical protein|nr:hypothetical protein [Hydrogenophilaceae bacterium]